MAGCWEEEVVGARGGGGGGVVVVVVGEEEEIFSSSSVGGVALAGIVINRRLCGLARCCTRPPWAANCLTEQGIDVLVAIMLARCQAKPWARHERG